MVRRSEVPQVNLCQIYMSRRTWTLTIKGNASGNATEADQDTPHLVDGNLTTSSAARYIRGTLKIGFEAESKEHHDQGRAKLAKALHGKDSSHHSSSPFGSRESFACQAGIRSKDILAL